MTTTLLLLLLPFFFFFATAAPAPPVQSPLPPPTTTNCSDELVSFSTCLSYISSSPNNLTDSPSHQCCKDVASAFTSGTAVCLCYFVKKPLILGFPLNSTRLYSLTSLCPMTEQGIAANLSLLSLCSDSNDLPPLLSITGPVQTEDNASDNHGSDNSTPPPSDIAQEETDVSGTADTADDYETETSPVDDFDQQERPLTDLDGTTPSISFAWKANNSNWCLFLHQIMRLLAWVSVFA